MKKHIAIALTVGTLTSTAFGQIAAIDWTSHSVNSTGATSTRGYSFNVTNAGGINVTHLSIFDQDANGLAEAHDVGIWDSSGNLLASTTISAGTASALDSTGKFRTEAISPVFLSAGSDYAVGGLFELGSGDFQAVFLNGQTMGAGITFGESRFINNGLSSLTFPTSTLGGISGMIGGSFSYEPVPEPPTITVLALAAVTTLRRRRNA